MKRLILSLIVVLAFAVVSTGCFHNTIVTSPDYDPAQEIADHEELRIHLLGLVPLGGPINLDALCPQGAGVVETRYLIGISIVDFSQARVHCSPGGAELDDEQLEQKLQASN